MECNRHSSPVDGCLACGLSKSLGEMEERARQREEEAIARHEEAIARHEAEVRAQRALESARTRYQVAKSRFEGNPNFPTVLEAIIAEDEFLHLSTGRHERTIREAPKLFGDLLRIVSVATKPGTRAVKGKSTRYPNRSSMKKSVQDAAKLITSSKHEIEGWEGSKANFKRMLQHPFVASNPSLVWEIRNSENLLKGKVDSFMARPEIISAIRVLSEARDREANLIKTHAWYFRLVRNCHRASRLGLVSCFGAIWLKFFGSGDRLHDLNEQVNPQLLVASIVFVGLTYGIAKKLPRFITFLPPRK